MDNGELGVSLTLRQQQQLFFVAPLFAPDLCVSARGGSEWLRYDVGFQGLDDWCVVTSA